MNDDSMNEMSDIREGDILFNCPLCGKSMAIEPAGAGLMVPCANCGEQVQVPVLPDDAAEVPVPPARSPVANGEDPGEVIRQLDAALSMANAQVDSLISEKESLGERRAYLEQIRIAQAARLERIAGELEIMQEALDRALALLAEARAERPN